jgi:hypothetical protein
MAARVKNKRAERRAERRETQPLISEADDHASIESAALIALNGGHRGLTSARGKSAARSSLELTSIATGALVSSVPAEGSHS